MVRVCGWVRDRMKVRVHGWGFAGWVRGRVGEG